MARSKLKNTRGLNIRPAKKRDKTARASVQFNQNKDGTTTVVKKDDGDPTITYRSRDRRKTLKGSKVVKGTKTVSVETDASKKARKDWVNDGNPPSKYRTKSTSYAREDKQVPTSKRVTTSKPNPDYNKKKKPQKAYSDKAKNPGGGPGSRFIGKRKKMTDKEAGEYNRYLRRK